MGTASIAAMGGDDIGSAPIAWHMHSELQKRVGGGGVLHDFTAIRSGTLAELVRFVMLLPEEEQQDYAILKEGDHVLEPREIRKLAARADFPK